MAVANVSLGGSVKQFDGTGYSNWEFRVKLLLEQNEVLDVLEMDPPRDPNRMGDFKKKDIKARNIIVQCLSDNILESVKNKNYAKAIMDELKETYTKRGIANLVLLQNKMRNMKFQGKQPLSQFLIDFEKIILEIKNAGGALKESEVIVQLLSAMPESFHGVVTAIDVLFSQKGDEVSLNLVKSKLLQEEARHVQQSSDKEEEPQTFLSRHQSNRWMKTRANQKNAGNYRGYHQGGLQQTSYSGN